MAVTHDRPYGNSNFLVDFGNGDSRSVGAGFAEVIFPRFDVEPDKRPQADTASGGDASAPAAANRLILKRGVFGSLDLFAWWDDARQGRTRERRTVKIELLSDDQQKVVLTWRFANVRPVSLSYSPLRAMEGGIVMETVELAFDGVEMS
jgi:phage tail-like protein